MKYRTFILGFWDTHYLELVVVTALVIYVLGPFKRIRTSKREGTYCGWKRSWTSRYIVYPTIHRVWTIQGGAGFLPSTVWRDLFDMYWPRANRLIYDSRSGSKEVQIDTYDVFMRHMFLILHVEINGHAHCLVVLDQLMMDIPCYHHLSQGGDPYPPLNC